MTKTGELIKAGGVELRPVPVQVQGGADKCDACWNLVVPSALDMCASCGALWIWKYCGGTMQLACPVCNEVAGHLATKPRHLPMSLLGVDMDDGTVVKTT